jgi:hypothetical protein
MNWRASLPWIAVVVLGAGYAVDRRRILDESARIRGQIQDIKSQPQSAPVVQRVYVSPPAPAASAGSAPAPAPSEAPPVSPRSKITLASLKETFEQESRGAAAARNESDIRAQIAGVVQGPNSIERVDCRETMCRLQLAYADVPTSKQVMRDLFIGPEAKLQSGFVASRPEATEDGSVRSTIFVPSAGRSW